MLTEAGKYGKLYFAQSEKQSRVSTLTIAQSGDYWFDIETFTRSLAVYVNMRVEMFTRFFNFIGNQIL